MNQIYEQMWLYYNFFQPVMRLADKVIVAENGRTTRVKRVFDDARTPFDRLCATDAIPPDQRAVLEAWRQEINPRTLRRNIDAAIQELFQLPGAVPGQSENGYDSLFFPEDYALD